MFSSKAKLKVISSLFTDLAAAWFALALITPNFVKISAVSGLTLLTKDIVFGIVFLIFSIKIEETLESL